MTIFQIFAIGFVIAIYAAIIIGFICAGKQRVKRCPDCSGNDIRSGAYYTIDGLERNYYYCNACGYNTGHCLTQYEAKKKLFADYDEKHTKEAK